MNNCVIHYRTIFCESHNTVFGFINSLEDSIYEMQDIGKTVCWSRNCTKIAVLFWNLKLRIAFGIFRVFVIIYFFQFDWKSLVSILFLLQFIKQIKKILNRGHFLDFLSDY